MNDEKIVRFDVWCKECKYAKEDPAECDICNECLASPSNVDSHKPINFTPTNTSRFKGKVKRKKKK